MADTIVQVENLSKMYIIQHLSNERYTVLRDVLVRKAKAVGRKITQPIRNKISGPSREEFWALKNISFEVKRGDVVGIIGRNGAGKSTLLKILSRITEPTTGRVRLRGRVSSLLEVGTGFHPELTGRENIFLNGAILGMRKSEIKAKFDEIVAFAEIEKFIDTPVKRFSSGMYVRLAFAVAAHLDPEILIIDEVLAVGDLDFQKKCLGKMKEVSKGGRTVLFVSHNMTAIKNLCQVGILLQSGGIEQIGSVDDVIGNYVAKHNEELQNDFRGFDKYRDFEILDINFSLENNNDTIKMVANIVINFLENKNNIGFGINIKTSDGTLVSNISPKFTGMAKNFTKGSKEIKIVLENINKLPGGEYYVDFWVSRQGLEILLSVENIFKFNIHGEDVHNTGQQFLYNRHGFIVFKPKVEIC